MSSHDDHNLSIVSMSEKVFLMGKFVLSGYSFLDRVEEHHDVSEFLSFNLILAVGYLSSNNRSLGQVCQTGRPGSVSHRTGCGASDTVSADGLNKPHRLAHNLVRHESAA